MRYNTDQDEHKNILWDVSISFCFMRNKNVQNSKNSQPKWALNRDFNLLFSGQPKMCMKQKKIV